MEKNVGESAISNNETLLEQLRQKEQEQAILLNVGSSIAAARKREDLWNIITRQLLDLFGGKYYTLCLINEDGKTHTPFLHSDERTIRSRTEDSPIIHEHHPVEDGIFNVAIASDKPLIYDLAGLIRNKNIPAYIYHWFNAGIKEMLLVKISNGNETKGLLYFYSTTANAFSPSGFRLLTGIADQLGTGISNVLANEKIEQQLEEINRYKQRLENENLYLQEAQRNSGDFSEILGTSEEIQKVFTLISKVAPSDSTVLLSGETGTGKELAARAIHNASPRSKKLMIKLNCAAMPPNLIESELFGHEKGSFTGALDKRIGKFELASNSTLLLDEIGELPLEMQAKLLRVLQEKEIERIGGRGTIRVNVRIIAATNRNLEKEVQAGRFRADLYYRLNVFPVTLPSLNRRRDDIPLLATHFAERYARNVGKPVPAITPKAMETLMEYSWPGNIRELEHLIERTVLLNNGPTIKQFYLPVVNKTSGAVKETGFKVQTLEEVEREYILKVLRLCNGRIAGPNGAAVRLDLPSTTLSSRMQKLGIKKEHYVKPDETDTN